MVKNKEIAFCIFKYFKFGGLQRDFLRIALECQNRGFRIVVYANEWNGEIPDRFEIRKVKRKRVSNYKNALDFSNYINKEKSLGKINFIVSFNRINSADVYFAGDNCLREKILNEKIFLARFLPRNKAFCALENEVFSTNSKTHVMYLTNRQKASYIRYYNTQNDRFHLLPPGISEDRRRPKNAVEIRDKKRQELKIASDTIVLIQIGSGFLTKGLDRSIKAVASLNQELLNKIIFLVVGSDHKENFVKLSDKLKIKNKVIFLGGRTDVSELLLASDLMIHPAINEATGTVLVEALAEGLPVICSEACGYANLIAESKAGLVIPEAFSQELFNQNLSNFLTESNLKEKGLLAVEYTEKENFYNRQIIAADIIESVYNEVISKK